MRKTLNHAFSPDKISTEIIIGFSDDVNEAELFLEVKKYIQLWNRRREYYGGSRAGYCIELKKVYGNNRDV